MVAEVGAARRTAELEEQAARAEEGTAQLARELREVRHTAEHTEAQLLQVGSAGYCPPHHRHAFDPSLIELHGIP